MTALTRLPHIALAILLAVTLAGPPGAHAQGCPAQPLAQTFLPWADPAWYTPLPDAGFETGSGAWTLQNGATVGAGNEPYHVQAPTDERSLALPSGASAASAPVCVGATHPTLRFFARNGGSPLDTLKVSVAFRDSTGVERWLPVGAITGGSQWAPTPVVPVTVNALSPLGVQQVRFGFESDKTGQWWIDDVYVDPYGKG